MSKPLLAVTMGDPAGIGAEIIVKTFSDPGIFDRAQLFVVGNAACLEMAMEQTGIELAVLKIKDLSALAEQVKGTIQVIEPVP